MVINLKLIVDAHPWSSPECLPVHQLLKLKVFNNNC